MGFIQTIGLLGSFWKNILENSFEREEFDVKTEFKKFNFFFCNVGSYYWMLTHDFYLWTSYSWNSHFPNRVSGGLVVFLPDNSIWLLIPIRFSSFWWLLWCFHCFSILLVLFHLFLSQTEWNVCFISKLKTCE